MAKRAKSEVRQGTGKDASRWAGPKPDKSQQATRVQWALFRHDLRKQGDQIMKMRAAAELGDEVMAETARQMSAAYGGEMSENEARRALDAVVVNS